MRINFRPRAVLEKYTKKNWAAAAYASKCRLTRYINQLISFNFEIEVLAGNKMGLIDYLSRNPIGLAITPSAYDEKFVVASTNIFINILELIDNIILNNLANQNWAPSRLIKMGTENKRTLTSQARLRVHLKLFTHSKSAASKQINFDQIVKKTIQHSVKQPHQKTRIQNSSILFRNWKNQTSWDEIIIKDSKLDSVQMIKSINEAEGTAKWQGELDREGSLSDPPLHRRKTTKTLYEKWIASNETCTDNTRTINTSQRRRTRTQ